MGSCGEGLLRRTLEVGVVVLECIVVELVDCQHCLLGW